MRTWFLAMLAGCAGAEAMSSPTAQPQAAPFELGLYPGETMSYEVRLGGVLVGEAQLAVGEIGIVEGRTALVVKSRAATAGAAALVKNLVDESTTVVEIATGRPLRVDTTVVTNAERRTIAARFSDRGPNVDLTLQTGDQRPQHLTLIQTATLYDMHTAMAQIRTWRAPPGTSQTLALIGGRRMWQVEVRYVGEDTIGSNVGNRRAVIYDGASYRADRTGKRTSSTPTRTFRVWLSDDADRVPLKCVARTELGDIVMDLTEYARP